MMKLKELGALLQEERLRQGLTLDDIKDRTKVSEYVLRGIENGDASKLPVEVYAKSFVKSYVKVLNLDSEEMCKRLEELFPEDNSEFSSVTHRSVMTPLPSARQSMKSVFLVFLIFLLLGIGLWLGFSFMQEKWQSTGQAGRQVQEQEKSAELEDLSSTTALATKNNALFSEEQVTEPIISPDKNNEEEQGVAAGKTGNTGPLNEAVPENISIAAALPTNQAAAGEQDTFVPQEDDGIEEKKNVFELKAVGGECWLRAEADDKVIERFLRSGQEISFSYTNRLRLRLGDVSVLKATLNGKPYTFAREQAVQNLEILAEQQR